MPFSNDEIKFVRRLLRSRRAEALAWLEGESPGSMRILGEMTSERAIAVVRRLYDAGAETVLAVEIVADSRYESSNSLLIKMPLDEQSRGRLLCIQRELAEARGFDGDIDEGQKYVYIGLC